MDKVVEMLSKQTPQTVADYFDLYRKIMPHIKDAAAAGEKKMKIAVLCSFTLKGIEEVLSVKCAEAGIMPQIYLGGYNQHAQEILNPQSGLYTFSPDVVIVFIDTMTMLGERYFAPYDISGKEREDEAGNKLKEMQSLIAAIKQNSSAKILFHNFEVPVHSPLGIAECKQDFGFHESIRWLNDELVKYWKREPRVFFLDYEGFAAGVGKNDLVDAKMYYLADMRLSLKHLPALCEEYMGFLKPLAFRSKKCLVLDLDNTLWGGVLGEDGIDGIKLGPTPEGRPFWELQKYILTLARRGVILAINSRNNHSEVMDVLARHPYMMLKEEHFSAMRINWQDKATNIKEIAQELNIGLDSIVFFDDDRLNCRLVEEVLPEVKVVNMSSGGHPWHNLYANTAAKMNDFNILEITQEDKDKAEIYNQQKKRKDFQSAAVDLESYLKGLNTVLTIEEADAFNLGRIAQLTQKTNQFNMTTRRYRPEDITGLLNRGFLVFGGRVYDRFGDSGITAAAIVDKSSQCWRIDTFLLSCRVIGRKVEEAVLAYILRQAKRQGVDFLTGEFILTPKNAPAEGFYGRMGFKLREKKEGVQVWGRDTKQEFLFPGCIKIEEKINAES